MLSSLPAPVIFAHRGASSHAPENTLAAFQLAVDQGAKAIELDVQLTRDQEVVVFHDVLLERTTDGTGRLKDHTLLELKKLNAALSFSPAYQKEKIPTLAEVFELLPPDIIINIELKNLHAYFNSLPARTAEIIQKFESDGRVLISSFNPLALRKFSKEMPSIPLGRLLYTKRAADLYSSFTFLQAHLQSVHISYKSLNPQIISSFKGAGKKVFAYTLNHTQDIVNAIKMGIDGFFTDDPGFANRILVQEGLISQ